MLLQIELKNFKSWGNQMGIPSIGLAPITLMLGPNSAGKTSILQVPLLLKQTFESPDRHLDLNLGGLSSDLIDLGDFQSLIHNKDLENELTLGTKLIFQDNNEKTTIITYRATFKAVGGIATLHNLELDLNSSTFSGVFSVARQNNGKYLLKAPNYAPKKLGQNKQSYRPERSVSFSSEAIAELGPVGSVVQDVAFLLRREIGGIAYLGPLREHPERYYLWNGVPPSDLGICGQFAVQALLASVTSRKQKKEGHEGGRGWLIHQVSNWLARLGVADSLTLKRQGSSRHYELIVVRGKKSDNIIDVGFGVSQVLPMIVLAYFVPRGTTIIAEQPELHLHPRAQVALAELMAEVSKTRNVQFLIETHSEHLFRRLQTLIAEETLYPANCSLYFVEQDKNGSAALKKLEVDAFGKVSNWPKDFFGDSIGETERQTRKMLERIRLSRETRQA